MQYRLPRTPNRYLPLRIVTALDGVQTVYQPNATVTGFYRP